MIGVKEMAGLVRQLAESNATVLSASQLGHFIVNNAGGEVGSFYLIHVFHEAYPEIPFRDLIRACFWQGVCEKGMSDAEFDARLSRWVEGGRS